MSDIIRIAGRQLTAGRIRDEWLVTNGLGGYASTAVTGELSRRYHGLLIAALPGALGRMVMLSDLVAELADGGALGDADHLEEFVLAGGLPCWRYALGGVVIEKSLLLPSHHNIVHVTYRLVEGAAAATLRLRPFVNFRRLEDPVSTRLAATYAITARGDRYEITADPELPTLRLAIDGDEGASFTADGGFRAEFYFETEAQRGYESRGAAWTPGYFTCRLQRGAPLTLIAATERWHTVLALKPAEARRFETERRRRLLELAPASARAGLPAALVLAADTFVVTPIGRVADLARMRAEGDDLRTVIAGYHWFTDWGRDTMVSLEGLTLVTGRVDEARWILRTFAHYVRDGLIPNLFPEGESRGLYHTADATLWFIHALGRYTELTGDETTLRLILPVVKDIARHHLDGTRFGIGVDPADGLLRQGAEGYQLTWMDAKVGDWVVTPRRGKAVEINALWYNALCLIAGWLRQAGDPEADAIAGHAERARCSFNRRFWNARRGFLFDVVDGESGDDPAFRPNQIFAVSLANPVLDEARWPAVVGAVADGLLTPLGLRSLAPGEPDYRPRYFGDLRARDAAYHQGTVWAWLIGPFIDAWLRVHPGEGAAARKFLAAFEAHITEAGIGSISEVFDAEPPFAPRGCIAQAWSVAEVLRCLIATAGGGDPRGRNGAAADRPVDPAPASSNPRLREPDYQ
ncbi:MAG TPA: amylo-alpha-1,6-glucosidase [Stellaceae bacterium]|nr:amylo-alpha-1,6-glucosidase [Stellaceae bacterium]